MSEPFFKPVGSSLATLMFVRRCLHEHVVLSQLCVFFSQVLLTSMAQQVPAVSMAFTPVKVSSPSSSRSVLFLHQARLNRVVSFHSLFII